MAITVPEAKNNSFDPHPLELDPLPREMTKQPLPLMDLFMCDPYNFLTKAYICSPYQTYQNIYLKFYPEDREFRLFREATKAVCRKVDERLEMCRYLP